MNTKFDLITVFKGKESPMVYEVTDWKVGETVTLVGRGSTVKAVDTISFAAVPGDANKTRINYVADIGLKGLLSLATPFVQSDLKELQEAAKSGMIKAFAEGLWRN